MSKKLVAYFSCTGRTERVAKGIASVTGADLYRIEPTRPYTRADLNWNDSASRSSIEMGDDRSRPAIATRVEDMASYDVVFVGFPIWWYVAPRIVETFLESYDFAGKTIVPFATSGSSPFGNAARVLAGRAPGARLMGGTLLNGNPSEAKLRVWADGLGV